MIVFVFQLGWFPINGSYDISCTPGFNLPFIGSVLYHAVLPVMTYVLSTMGLWALQMKSSGIPSWARISSMRPTPGAFPTG